ncbi:MAG: DNA alkylation repair protein [Flavobacteriales bacterium]|nr:DNA alkylation repair protein [Flavobacteriales bacterium]
MAEPLKEMFNRAYFERLAREVERAAPQLWRSALLKDLLNGNEQRELNARLRHTSDVLRTHLPQDFREAIALLKKVAPRMPKGYTALLYPDFIGQHGLNDPAFSLEALKHFTTYGSSEFAVREFFRRDPQGTLQVMRAWAEDEDEHVRRLASEGSRPRLPWSFRLDAVMKDPTLTTPILERLRADDSLYVRKSVANHLNDIGKDHPDHMLGILRSWDRALPQTAWIAKHASRTLIKAGNVDALALFAFDSNVMVRVEALELSPERLKLGEVLMFSFSLVSEAAREQQLVIDYAIHYRKANGGNSRKVFKLKEITLGPRASVGITKRQRFIDFSTRKHYAGEHSMEILVNGNVMARAAFQLTT